MAFNAMQEENIAAYGGGAGYGYGGGGVMIVLILLILFALFRKDGFGGEHEHGHGFGGFGGCGCGPCVQPTFKDESNFEEERNINAKLCCVDKDIWKTDRDVWKTACETQKEIACDGQKTRSLIEANYIQDLRDKLAEKNSEVMTLKSEAFTKSQVDGLGAVLGRKIEVVDEMVERLACELPKRPPVFCETITPNTHHTDCDLPRRRNCCGFERFDNDFAFA